MRDIKRIIIHCSATDGDVSADKIREWHKAKGWRDIGYHYVIRSDGAIEIGRPLEEQGAHTYRQNVDSVGICIAGGRDGTTDDYTAAQWRALRMVVEGLRYDFNILSNQVYGHNQFTDSKTCPNFDVFNWIFGLGDFRE